MERGHGWERSKLELPEGRDELEGFEEVHLVVALVRKELGDHWVCFVWLKLGELE